MTAVDPNLVEAFGAEEAWVDDYQMVHIEIDCHQARGGLQLLESPDDDWLAICDRCETPIEQRYHRRTTQRETDKGARAHRQNMATRYKRQDADRKRAARQPVARPAPRKRPAPVTIPEQDRDTAMIVLTALFAVMAMTGAAFRRVALFVWKRRRKIRRWASKNPLWVVAVVSLVVAIIGAA